MYLKINKIVKEKTKFWFDTKITHISLYKDDWTFIKFVKHTDDILDKLKQINIDITIPELDWLLNEKEVEKIVWNFILSQPKNIQDKLRERQKQKKDRIGRWFDHIEEIQNFIAKITE